MEKKDGQGREKALQARPGTEASVLSGGQVKRQECEGQAQQAIGG
jgi:hypothetical protein